MIKLSIQDKFDGTNKIQELRDAIGSETEVGTLVSISKSGDIATLKFGKQTRKEQSWRTWNRLFF